MLEAENYFKLLKDNAQADYFSFLKYIIKYGNYSSDEYKLILKAYHKANTLHRGMFRKSGEPYINHPISVAYILAKRGFDAETICAALLHDTLEDTKYTYDDLKRDFGLEIADLVDGVTKINSKDSKVKSDETHKKILQSMTKDARIVVIKLADRIHNLLTLDALEEEKKIRIANESQSFYVPLARFNGIYELKNQIQDLSFYYLDPVSFEKYYRIYTSVRKKYVDEYSYIRERTKEELAKKGINLETNYKVKNVGGIFDEVVEDKKNIYQIRDLVAIRMILENCSECYETLDIISKTLKPDFGTFKDYIKNPKYNGYQSLNINVLTNNDSDFQVRIRTKQMQRQNELGIVSNWNFKTQELVNKMCNELVEISKENLPADKFVEESERVFLKKRGE